MNGRTIAWGLAIAGLIPFVGCAVMVLTQGQAGQLWVEPLGAYGAIILSFLGGARWGRAMSEPEPKARTLVFSNLPAVAAWLTFLPPVPNEVQLLTLIFGFVFMLFWDYGDAPPWYRNLRIVATMGAVLSLGVVWQSF